MSPIFIEHGVLCHNDLSLKMGCSLQGSHCKLTPTVGYQKCRNLVLLWIIRGRGCLEVVRVGMRCLRWSPISRVTLQGMKGPEHICDALSIYLWDSASKKSTTKISPLSLDTNGVLHSTSLELTQSQVLSS